MRWKNDPDADFRATGPPGCCCLRDWRGLETDEPIVGNLSNTSAVPMAIGHPTVAVPQGNGVELQIWHVSLVTPASLEMEKVHQRKNNWQPKNWEKKQHLISQQNPTLKISSGQISHVFARSVEGHSADFTLTDTVSNWQSSFGKPDSGGIKSGWSDMELWVHESILILTSELDLVLSLEKIYSTSNSRSNMLHLHMETDASQCIDVKCGCTIDWNCIVQQQVRARVPIFSLKQALLQSLDPLMAVICVAKSCIMTGYKYINAR